MGSVFYSNKIILIPSYYTLYPRLLLISLIHAAAKLLQSCPTLYDPRDSSPPGSPVPGILQARTLEWVAISFSNAWKWKVKVKSLSRVQLFATPWTAAHQASLSISNSRSLLKLMSIMGEGNGTPLQCSCLENPRDRGAWWAAVYGVAESRTRLSDLAAAAADTGSKD